MKTIHLLFLVIAMLVTGIVISCKKDKCADQYCLNGGDCKDGSCICPNGFTGEHCELTSGGAASYNCVSGNCTLVASNGQYASYTECANACGGGSGGYNCVSGNCTSVTSNAQYATLNACQSACSSGGAGYNCVSGNCTSVSSNAQYATLNACQSACSNSTAGYNCVSGNCNAVSSNAQYTTLSACQSACTVSTAGYNCNNGNCSAVNSNAQYPTLSACQSACTVSTAGYNCSNGNCNYVNSNAQYATLSACQNACAPANSTITFTNTTYTTMSITFNGIYKTASAGGGTAVFTGSPGNYGTGSAETSGKTSNGSQIGLNMTWNLSYQFPSSGNANVNLNIGSNFFFLKIRNNGSAPLTPIYVNYGLNSESVDYISIPNDNQVYNVGYYNAWTNTNVRGYRGSYYTYWDQGVHFYLPFDTNQSVTLLNTLYQEAEPVSK